MSNRPSPQPSGEQKTASSPSPAAGEAKEGQSGGKPPAYVPPATREKRQRSVVHYIAILFAAAFILMLLT